LKIQINSKKTRFWKEKSVENVVTLECYNFNFLDSDLKKRDPRTHSSPVLKDLKTGTDNYEQNEIPSQPSQEIRRVFGLSCGSKKSPDPVEVPTNLQSRCLKVAMQEELSDSVEVPKWGWARGWGKDKDKSW